MRLLIISFIIQLAVVVHVIKTGRGMMWVFIVLFFPLIGCAAYFIIEVLPELRNSRAGRNMRRGITRAVDPNREFRTASRNLAIADTPQNAIVLAEQLLEKGSFAEARELYQRYLKGVHAGDPVLLLGIARASFGLGEFGEAARSLEQLKEENPGIKSPEGHLLYARTQEALGNAASAIHEYEALCRYYPGPEPAARLALLLKSSGDMERAGELFRRILQESDIAGRHYNSIHREWVDIARREAAQ